MSIRRDLSLRAIPPTLLMLALAACGSTNPYPPERLRAMGCECDSACLARLPDHATRRLSGKVRDGEGRPIAGACLRLTSYGGEETYKLARTGDEGEFSFTGIARGGYYLRVEAPGHCCAVLFVEIRKGPDKPAEIILSARSGSAG